LNGVLEIYAPSLIIYEVANALRFHRIYKLSKDDIVSAVRSLYRLGIIKNLSYRGWLEAIEISLDKKISVYDAVYVALTKIINGTFVTCDEELKKK